MALAGSAGNPLADYKIYGSSVQDGTPTTDNPVEIQSVGDKTYNLIEYDPIGGTVSGVTVEQKADGSIVCNGTAEADIIVSVGWFNMYNGKRYKGTGCPAGGSTSTYRLFFNYLGADLGNGSSSTLMTADQRAQVRIFIYKGQVCDNLIFYPMATEVPDTTTKYPYKKAGYEIPIVVEPKNLFNRSALTKDYSYTERYGDYGIKTIKPSSGNRGFHFPINIKKGETYTVSFKLIDFGGDGVRGYVRYRNSDGDNIQSNGFVFNSVNKIYSANFTATEDLVFAEFYTQSTWATDSYYTIDEIMISRLSDKVFEPYFEPTSTLINLNEPLRKIGTYADYIDFENKKVIKNIKIETLTTTSWSKYSTYNTYFTAQFSNAKYAINTPCFCNFYEGKNSGSGTSYGNGKAWFQNDPTYKRFYISDDNCTTLDSLKAYLADLAAVTPIKVAYVLNEPTEETIELPEIQTHKGTNILSVDTTVQPSNIEVTYAANI